MELIDKAVALAEREIEVVETADGKYIVLWMSFTQGPPPKGDTEVEALESFIEYMETIKQENTDDNRTGSITKNDQNAESTQSVERSE